MAESEIPEDIARTAQKLFDLRDSIAFRGFIAQALFTERKAQRERDAHHLTSHKIFEDSTALGYTSAMLTEAQIMILRTIERQGKRKPKKAKHVAGYVKPPEIPVVEENVRVLLMDGLVRSMGPYSRVVRISEKGRAALAALGPPASSLPEE